MSCDFLVLEGRTRRGTGTVLPRAIPGLAPIPRRWLRSVRPRAVSGARQICHLFILGSCELFDDATTPSGCARVDLRATRQTGSEESIVSGAMMLIVTQFLTSVCDRSLQFWLTPAFEILLSYLRPPAAFSIGDQIKFSLVVPLFCFFSLYETRRKKKASRLRPPRRSFTPSTRPGAPTPICAQPYRKVGQHVTPPAPTTCFRPCGGRTHVFLEPGRDLVFVLTIVAPLSLLLLARSSLCSARQLFFCFFFEHQPNPLPPAL